MVRRKEVPGFRLALGGQRLRSPEVPEITEAAELAPLPHSASRESA